MCTTLLRRKYVRDRGFYCVNSSGGSQFWRGVHEVKNICHEGLKYLDGNGKKLDFGMMFGWGIVP
jgi:hypothetical protein